MTHYPYDATDALARLTGKLDAAIRHPDLIRLTLADVRDELVAARRLLFTQLHDGYEPGPEYR